MQGQVINPWHQTIQGQSFTKTTTPLVYIYVYVCNILVNQINVIQRKSMETNSNKYS